MEVDHWRAQIDEIDTTLVALLNRRANCAIEIGRAKRATGRDAYDPERERQVLERVRALNRGPLDGRALVRLFERIIDESRRLEREVIEDENA